MDRFFFSFLKRSIIGHFIGHTSWTVASMLSIFFLQCVICKSWFTKDNFWLCPLNCHDPGRSMLCVWPMGYCSQHSLEHLSQVVLKSPAHSFLWRGCLSESYDSGPLHRKKWDLFAQKNLAVKKSVSRQARHLLNAAYSARPVWVQGWQHPLAANEEARRPVLRKRCRCWSRTIGQVQ